VPAPDLRIVAVSEAPRFRASKAHLHGDKCQLFWLDEGTIPTLCGCSMCQACEDLALRIQQFKWFISKGLDDVAARRLKFAVKRMEEEKESLHPEKR
jgi:hypothetical protein